MVTLRTDAGWVPSPEDTPYLRLGEPKIRALVEAFYDAMQAHEPELTKTHRLDEHGHIPREFRDTFALFLIFWLGGPQGYLEARGHPRLRMRHARVPVDEAMRDAWVRSMQRAMDATGIDGEVRGYLDARFADVATFLRNVAPPDSGPVTKG
jgi:hemoglobin